MTSFQTIALSHQWAHLPRPGRPIAVICLDGSADEYLDAALVRGRVPNLQKFAIDGYRGLARAPCLPSPT